jgi:hypothetical protein
LRLFIYFIAVVGLAQAQPQDVVLTGTLATAVVVLWRLFA